VSLAELLTVPQNEARDRDDLRPRRVTPLPEQPRGTGMVYTDDRSRTRDIIGLVGNVANFVGRVLRHLPESGYHSDHAGRF
jgi:hypothetical protein